MNRKKIVLCISVLLVICGSVLAYFLILRYDPDFLIRGEYDQMGSNGHITSRLDRDDTWLKIVEDSIFRLGDSEDVDYIPRDGTEEGYLPFPAMDGSTVAVPMALEFIWQHLDLDDYDGKHFVTFNTTHEAYLNLIGGEPIYGGYISSRVEHMYRARPLDIIIATPPSDEELAIADTAGVELYMEPVCYDAFVFITHRDNPVESLTIDQIREIYSGMITNWSEVGGNDEKIIPFQRDEGSGSQTAMEKMIMQGSQFMDPPILVEGMGILIDSVAEYQNGSNSLGYTYLYYIDVLYKSTEIKTLAINGTEPSTQNIINGTYPLSVNYYGIIRNTDRENVGGLFLDWMCSNEGQACIAQAGYIPMQGY